MTDVSTLDTATRGHHPDSPSSLQSSEACPLFLNEQRESKASSDGTLQHKAAELREPGLLDGDPDWLAAYEKVIAYEDNVIEYHIKKFGVPPSIVKEKYLAVGDDSVLDSKGANWLGVTGGFPDIVIVSERHADVLDWKFGRVPVTPTKDNLQGIAYAVASFEAWPELQTVAVHFFAPHQGWSDEAQVAKYVHTFSRTDVPTLELRIRTVVSRKHAATKQLDATGSWVAAAPKMDLCIWCARKGSCKKLHAVVIQGAEKNPTFIVPETTVSHQLTRPEQYKQAFRWANQVITIAEAIKHRVSQAVLTEDLDLGEDMKIVKRTDRQIKSVAELIACARRHGVKLREIIPIITVSIGKLEGLVKSKAAKGKGAEAIRALGEDALESGALELGRPIYFVQEARSPKEKQPGVIELT